MGLGFCLWAGGRLEYKNSMTDRNTKPPVCGFVGLQNLRVSERGLQGALTGMKPYQELSPGHLGCSVTGEASAIWPSLQAGPGVVSLPLGPSSKNQACKARKQALANAHAAIEVTPQESAFGQQGLVKLAVAVCDESVVRGDSSDLKKSLADTFSRCPSREKEMLLASSEEL